MAIVTPQPFLEIRTEILDLPSTVGLCSGFEGQKWRSRQLAKYIVNWLPYIALKQEDQLSFGAHNFVEMLGLASAHIYNSKKTDTRGEIGEILLHLACVTHKGTMPVMCKLVLKTSSNDTVKGFDGIHVLPSGDSFEIWLGESKFYKCGKQAIKDAVSSVGEHILPHFLNTEKAMVFGHVAEGIPNRDKVKKLFQAQTSSDELLKMAVFPVLIAYESQAVKQFNHLCSDYVKVLEKEIINLRTQFIGLSESLKFRFNLIFVPIENKNELVKFFDEQLMAYL